WHSSVVTIPLHKLLQSASTRLLTGMIGAASLACRWPLFAGLSFLSGSVRSLCCSCTNIVASTKTWHLRLYLCSILAAHLAPLSEVLLLVGGRVPPSSVGHMCLLYQCSPDCYYLRGHSRGHSSPLLQLCFTCRFHCM